jgi:alcohol dehydrogenase class IV
MSIRYDFLAPARICFGWGRFNEAGALAAGLGRRAFIVGGSRTLERAGVLARLGKLLGERGVEPVFLGTAAREPRVEDVDRLAAALPALREGDLVAGIGGGSAIDLAKAVAAMARNRRSTTVRDYLEGVGAGLSLDEDPLPVLAIPTTAGTGSEATKNAVISSDDPPYKKSLRSDRMVPRAVLIDPELAVTSPPSVTAASGMDALTQLIESYLSGRAQPIPRALAREGIPLAAASLERAVKEPQSREAREGMAQAALLSGLALANSGLGMAHGVAAALGITCGVAHGLACAVMLPAALEANRRARRAEVAEIGRILSGKPLPDDEEAALAAPAAARELGNRIGIPRRLGELGVERAQIPELVRGSRGNSMSANPRPIEDAELTAILEALL